MENNNTNCKNLELVMEAMKLADKMLVMADYGAKSCQDDGCLLIFGVIRDCGYKIRKTVEYEKYDEITACSQHHTLQ